MTHILNPKNSQPLDKNLNLAMPTFGPTTREYYITSLNPISINPPAVSLACDAFHFANQ
jgi:hypothetical protein